MMHAKRRWCLSSVESPQALAKMLTERTWTLCSGFFVAGHPDYLFLNDATIEDGAGEYGIVRRLPDGTFRQIESITFSWCDAEKAQHYIDDALAGTYDASDFAHPVQPRLDTPDQHRRCHLCA